MDIAQRLAQWAENDMRAEAVALEAKHEIERLRKELFDKDVEANNAIRAAVQKIDFPHLKIKGDEK